jgi:hypothetical protein
MRVIIFTNTRQAIDQAGLARRTQCRIAIIIIIYQLFKQYKEHEKHLPFAGN